MNSDYYWEKFIRTGKISDYLACRHPGPEVIRHYTPKDTLPPDKH